MFSIENLKKNVEKLISEEKNRKMVAVWSGTILAFTLFTAVFFMDDDLINKLRHEIRGNVRANNLLDKILKNYQTPATK